MLLKQNLIANYLGQAWVGLMGFVFAPLYITYIGVEAYGLIGIFTLMQAWLSLLDMGMTPTLGREMARFKAGTHTSESIRDLLRSIEVAATAIAVFICSAAILGASWIANYWLKTDDMSVETVIQTFSIMGFVVGLRFVESVYRSAIIGLQRQIVFNVVSSVLATVRWGGAAAILIWVSPKIEAFFVWQAIVSVVTLGMLVYITYETIPHGKRSGRFSFDELRMVSKFASGILGINFLSLLLTQIDKTVLSTLISLTDFSYYTLAATVASTLFMLIGPVTQAFYPKLCEMHARGDNEGLSEAYHTGAQLSTVSAGSVALMLIFFSEVFLKLWTQDSNVAEKVAPLLSVLAIGNLLNGLMWMPYQAQLACGWTRLAFNTNLVAVIFITPAIIFGAKNYGAIGAAWLWVALNVGYFCVAVQFMYKRILQGEKWRWYKLDVIIPLLPSALAVFALSKLLEPLQNNWIGQVFSLVVASIVSVAIAIMNAPRVRQLIFK